MMNFMGIVFTFYLYAQSQQGKLFSNILSSFSIFSREYIVGGLHIISVSILVGGF
jgi:hypothetical protein